MTSKTISTTVNGYRFAASNSSLTITATGKVNGNGDFGLSAVYADDTHANETVVNLGTITSANQLRGVNLRDGGTVINGSATASISGSDVGIKITGKAGTISNLGSIYGYTNAIYLHNGGTVTNGSATNSTARLRSVEYAAIRIDYGVSKVTNFGTIQGENDLDGGGTFTNQSTGKVINAGGVAVHVTSGTVSNFGTVTGQVKVDAGQIINGSKTNHAATIGGSQNGVYIGETGTLTNFGAINGTNAAVYVGYHAVMIAEAGSKVNGPSFGANGTLVFGAAGGAGTISGLGTGTITGSTLEKFSDLTSYGIEAGANWTLSGAKNNLKAGDSLKVSGTLALAGSLLGGGNVSITGAGVIDATAAGAVQINTAIVNGGLLIAGGGTLTLTKAVTGGGSARINGGATLVTAGTFSEAVKFNGATGVLQLNHAKTYTGSITGFSKTGGTTLDLRDIKFVSASEAKFTGTTTGGTLTVSDGTSTAKIKLVGNYTGVTFKASSDGHGGTKIVDAAKAASVPGFISAVAGVGASAGGTISPRSEAPHTWTLLAHPRS